MSSLRWKVKRLLAMSPSEVATRLARALQERVAPLTCLSKLGDAIIQPTQSEGIVWELSAQ